MSLQFTIILRSYLFPARAEAVQFGLELQQKQFFHHVTFDHEFSDANLFYRLLGDGYTRALNAQLSFACIPRPGELKRSSTTARLKCTKCLKLHNIIVAQFDSCDGSVWFLCTTVTLTFLCVAVEVAEDLRRYIVEIYDDFLSADGTVSY